MVNLYPGRLIISFRYMQTIIASLKYVNTCTYVIMLKTIFIKDKSYNKRITLLLKLTVCTYNEMLLYCKRRLTVLRLIDDVVLKRVKEHSDEVTYGASVSMF